MQNSKFLLLIVLLFSLFIGDISTSYAKPGSNYQNQVKAKKDKFATNKSVQNKSIKSTENKKSAKATANKKPKSDTRVSDSSKINKTPEPRKSNSDRAAVSLTKPQWDRMQIVSGLRGRLKSQPKTLNYVSSNGARLKVDPKRTTTVLGSYKKDMEHIIKELKLDLSYMRNVDFAAKKGHFNVLNTPDSLYKGNDKLFFNRYNKPFLDKAVARGDRIAVVTKPTSRVLYKKKNGEILRGPDGKPLLTTFGREMQYLKETKGYRYDGKSQSMIKIEKKLVSDFATKSIKVP